jgi:hypothetical protein
MEFVVKRGETLTILLDDMDGIAAEVASVTARLRPGIASKRAVDPDEPAEADFAVVSRAAEGNDPAGWGLILSATTTAGIATGFYMVDARLVMDGGTEIVTDPLAIRVTEPATVRS